VVAPCRSLRRTGFLIPGSGIQGKVEGWHTAPGSTPTLLAMGSDGRVAGKVAAALEEAWTLCVPLPSQMGTALGWSHILCRAGYSENLKR
jgi:hypothetical protein